MYGCQERRLPDGRTLLLQPLTFGCGRVSVGDGAVFPDVWDYDTFADAVAAWLKWDGTGEPQGWKRHMPSGRRRPGGDPTKEYVLP